MNKLTDLLEIEDNSIHALEFAKYDELNSTTHLIIMYPIHGFNPPRTVNRFVKNLPEGLYEKVSLIAVGCNNLWLNDAVSLKLRKLLERKQYEIVVDEILAMPLTFVMDFPEETKVKTIDEANSKIVEISEKILNSETSKRAVKIKSKLISTIGKLESPAARLFGLELHAKKNCTSCSICWNNCPEYNIKQGKNNKPKFGFSCSMCMRCIYSCPEQAITPYISKFLTIKNGYKIEE
jgi:ferredoxin